MFTFRVTVDLSRGCGALEPWSLGAFGTCECLLTEEALMHACVTRQRRMGSVKTEIMEIGRKEKGKEKT